MKYLSNEQIQESLKVLRPYNVFFCTTFLVLKLEKVPVGSMKRFSLDAENRKFLDKHYRVHPKSKRYFRVMRKSDMAKDWVASNFASTGLQSVNTRTFHDALLHEKNDNTWGWAENYVQRLVAKLPRGKRIPLIHLASWLYKYQVWDEESSRSDVIARMIDEYGLNQNELAGLFLTTVDSNLTEEQAFDKEPLGWHELLAPFSRPDDVPAETSGILAYLETQSLGPTSSLVFRPAPRLNLITGDNGLGKTFVLDLAWWALTQNWVDLPANPIDFSPSRPPLIKFLVEGTEESRQMSAKFVKSNWIIREKRSVLAGLVVYARVDGSFAIWDPVNNTLARSSSSRWPGMTLTREEVWNGKNKRMEGLIRDLVKWQQRPDRYPAFATFVAALSKIYPPDIGPFSVGEPVRIPNNYLEIPTLNHPYGNVPILFESAGIRRAITLTYLLVWVWEEHKLHAQQQGEPEERQMVVLLDEAEAHLHPKWQRTILPGLLEVARDLHAEMSAQWIITSHSPLVLASVEGYWETKSDRLFHLEMNKKGEVEFERLDFGKRGTIDSWLTSEVFEFSQSGSRERERAIQEAIALQQTSDPTKDAVEAATEQLRKNLSNEDPFWIRWIFYAHSRDVEL